MTYFRRGAKLLAGVAACAALMSFQGCKQDLHEIYGKKAATGIFDNSPKNDSTTMEDKISNFRDIGQQIKEIDEGKYFTILTDWLGERPAIAALYAKNPKAFLELANTSEKVGQYFKNGNFHQTEAFFFFNFLQALEDNPTLAGAFEKHPQKILDGVERLCNLANNVIGKTSDVGKPQPEIVEQMLFTIYNHSLTGFFVRDMEGFTQAIKDVFWFTPGWETEALEAIRKMPELFLSNPGRMAQDFKRMLGAERYVNGGYSISKYAGGIFRAFNTPAILEWYKQDREAAISALAGLQGAVAGFHYGTQFSAVIEDDREAGTASPFQILGGNGMGQRLKRNPAGVNSDFKRLYDVMGQYAEVACYQIWRNPHLINIMASEDGRFGKLLDIASMKGYGRNTAFGVFIELGWIHNENIFRRLGDIKRLCYAPKPEYGEAHLSPWAGDKVSMLQNETLAASFLKNPGEFIRGVNMIEKGKDYECKGIFKRLRGNAWEAAEFAANPIGKAEQICGKAKFSRPRDII